MELPVSVPAFCFKLHQDIVDTDTAAHRNDRDQTSGKAYDERDHIRDPQEKTAAESGAEDIRPPGGNHSKGQ